MSKATESTNWVINYDIAAAGNKKFTLDTENHFIDKDIEINISTPAGTFEVDSAAVEASSNVGILGTASSSQPASSRLVLRPSSLERVSSRRGPFSVFWQMVSKRAWSSGISVDTNAGALPQCSARGTCGR